MAPHAAPEPFRIDVADSVLDDLQQRLALTRWPDDVPGSEWRYGTSLAYAKELVAYWQSDYDWRVQERLLNSFPQYRVELDDVTLQGHVVQFHPVLREAVQQPFLDAPVVIALPVGDEFLGVGEAGAVAPLAAGHVVRPAGQGETLLQVIEDGIGNVNAERLGGGVRRHAFSSCYGNRPG